LHDPHDFRLRFRPQQRYFVPQGVLRNAFFQGDPHVPFPDDDAAKAPALLFQDLAGLDQILKPLFLDQASNPHQELRIFVPLKGPEPVEVNAVVEADNPP
jgi:hypothetical protein